MMLQPVWVVLVPGVVLLAFSLGWAVRCWPGSAPAARALALVRVLLAAVAVLIGLHPVGAVRVSVPRETPVDLVVLLDRTTSMGAIDHAGSQPRMSGATADLTDLVTEVAGARIAVIVFDDEARLAVPFTTDVTTVTGFWQTVGWRPSAKASGSDVSVAVELAEQTLRRAAADRPGHDRYLVYAGDGEQTAERAAGSFAPLRELVTASLVLGYGTRAGAPMRVSADRDDLVRLDGTVPTSRADPQRLRAIAEQLAGAYHHRTERGSLPRLVTTPPGGTTSELRPGREYYWIFALVAGVGVVALGGASVRALRTVREEVRDAAG